MSSLTCHGETKWVYEGSGYGIQITYVRLGAGWTVELFRQCFFLQSFISSERMDEWSRKMFAEILAEVSVSVWKHNELLFKKLLRPHNATKRDKIETTAWYSGISPGIMIFLWCYNLQSNHHNTANALRNREHLPSKDHLMTNKSWTKWKDQAMQSGDCHSAVAGITLNMYWIWPDSLF